MPAPESPVPSRDRTTPAAPDVPPVTVETVRRVHVSEDWLATVVGLTVVAVGLLGLIPEGLVH